MSEAEKAYYDVLAQNGKSHEEFEENTVTGKITTINSAVKDGNVALYFKFCTFPSADDIAEYSSAPEIW